MTRRVVEVLPFRTDPEVPAAYGIRLLPGQIWRLERFDHGFWRIAVYTAEAADFPEDEVPTETSFNRTGRVVPPPGPEEGYL